MLFIIIKLGIVWFLILWFKNLKFLGGIVYIFGDFRV